MDVTAKGLVRNWLPTLPGLVFTAILAVLGLSPNAHYQDAVTEIIVKAARPVLGSPASLHASQKHFNHDSDSRGQMWISRYTIPVPVSNESDDALTIEQAVRDAIRALAVYDDEKRCAVSPLQTVGAEWNAYRPGVSHLAARPSGSEREMYDLMMSDVGEAAATILYAHGGAFCLMDPANHRWKTTMLSQYAGVRVFSVRYRLSPQNVFPAALMDMFVAYLSLLAPPPQAYHKPILASEIVIAGDSSGANLASSLILLLLYLRGKHIQWFGGSVKIPEVPATALSLTSPWFDITRSLPSCSENARWDIIAPPPPLIPTTLSTSPLFPADEIWPAKPPRTETYCTADMVSHCLVSPITAPTWLLARLPPVYICVGWEGMQDEAEVFARRAYLAGANIEFHGYMGMPHTFSFVPFNKIGYDEVKRRSKHLNEAVVCTLERTDYARWYDKKGRMHKTSLAKLGLTSDYSGYRRRLALSDEVLRERLERGRTFRVNLEKWLQAGSKGRRPIP